jgi:hypothetical protein
MQKLIIFGDSYARKDSNILQEKSWHNFIEETKHFNVVNMGEPGSDLWFSYDLFLKHQKDFDKIIFLVTAPNRIRLNQFQSKIWHNQNLTTASIKLKSSTGEEKEQYRTVVDYYKLIHNKDKDEHLHQLMIDNLKRIRPDAVIYPCFDNEWSTDMPLYTITKYEDCFIGMNDSVRKEFYQKGLSDSRACHMTEENNKIVSKMFLSRLQGLGEFDNLSESLLTPPKHGLNYYYQSTWI